MRISRYFLAPGFFFFSLFTALAPAACAADAPAATAAACVEAGDVLMQEEKTTEALAAFEKALALDPDFAGLHARLGALYTMLKQYDKAVVAIEQAVKRDPKLEKEALPELILVCAYLNNPKAVTYLNRLNQTDPQLGKHLAFQVFHARINGIIETEDGFEIGRPVPLPPDPADKEYLSGFMANIALYVASDEFENAIDVHTEALALNECSPKVTAAINHSMGMIYATKLKEPRKGLEYLEKAADLWPENTEFAIHLVDTYRLLENYPAASKVLELMLALDPTSKYALFFMGSTQLKMDRWCAAIDQWNKLREQDEILFGLIQKEYEACKSRCN